MPSDFKKANVL